MRQFGTYVSSATLLAFVVTWPSLLYVTDFVAGDIFIGVNGGTYYHYDSNGHLSRNAE